MLLRNTGTKTDMITLLVMIIFALHQGQTFIKFDPCAHVARQPAYRAESLSQLWAFIITIGTFLPLQYYLVPVLIIYAGTYGLTYYYAE
jgi:hypothetical protein